MALKRPGRRPPDVAAPTQNLPVPSAASDGAIMVSAGKYARNIVMGVFEQIGGQDNMAEWAAANPGDFYTKLFAKTITREVEERRADTIEDLIDAIDADSEIVATDAEFEDVK